MLGGWALPLWKMMEWKSVGMMTFPTGWKNKSHVPNHQPGYDQHVFCRPNVWPKATINTDSVTTMVLHTTQNTSIPKGFPLGAIFKRTHVPAIHCRGAEVISNCLFTYGPYGPLPVINAYNPFPLSLNVPQILKTRVHLQFRKISDWPIWLLIDPL